MGNIRREHVPYEINSNVAQSIDNSQYPQWPSFHFYNQKWGFSEIIKNRDAPNLYIYSSLRDHPFFSGLMFTGKYRLLDQVKGQFSAEGCGRGTGHLAKFNAPGIRGLLSGNIPIVSNRFDNQVQIVN